MNERNLKIYKSVLQGSTFASIAEIEAISPGRVRQIFTGFHKKVIRCSNRIGLEHLDDSESNSVNAARSNKNFWLERLNKIVNSNSEQVLPVERVIKPFSEMSAGEKELLADRLQSNMELLNKSVVEIEFTARTLNCLNKEGIKHLGDLVQYSKKDLSRIPNLGIKSFREIVYEIGTFGLKIHK